MILALGVLPNLLPGIGTPIHKRSQFLQILIKVRLINLSSIFISKCFFLRTNDLLFTIFAPFPNSIITLKWTATDLSYPVWYGYENTCYIILIILYLGTASVKYTRKV